MATRNIVPRATGEGSIGTSAKTWGAGYFDNLAVTNIITGNVTGNVTGTASGNLPLSGGTMTGTIYQNSVVPIQRNTNDSYLQINGGNGTNNGGNIILFGKSESRAGSFRLNANDGNTTGVLQGNADGTLTWNSKSILTKDNITTQEKTGSAFSANAGAVFSNASISVALSGYTPIGIVGWEITGTNASYANITKAVLSGTTVNFSGRNTASSNVSWTPKATVLYVKN